ncbi:hypothetical protein LCGC14_0399600 [marine sediment metagenome]|uniref:Uncharacterized protein n=1 Tax=marine sediment metagenome TaxID=412755 RepID=A0A0F9W657_9ZZZZ
MSAIATEIPRFRDVQFMTAKLKTKVFRAWIRFLKSGFNKTQFSEELYNHLIQNCQFIAHFNQWGFYDVYFDEPQGTRQFVAQFDPNGSGRSAEYGMDSWLSGDYKDINEAMRQAMGKFVERSTIIANVTEHRRDAVIVKMLCKKHGWTTPDGVATWLPSGETAPA